MARRKFGFGGWVKDQWDGFVAANTATQVARMGPTAAAQKLANDLGNFRLRPGEKLALDRAPKTRKVEPIPLRGPMEAPRRGDGMRIGPLGSGADLEVKGGLKGAQIFGLRPEIYEAFPHVVETWREQDGPIPVITSGNDGVHRHDSRHYRNLAVDIRGNNLGSRRAEAIERDLRRRLGPNYFVDYETFPKAPSNNHVHIEYDPRPRR